MHLALASLTAFDVGTQDNNDLLERFRLHFPDANRCRDYEEAVQTSWLFVRPPIFRIWTEENAIELIGKDAKVERTALFFPSGVVIFRDLFYFEQILPVSDIVSLREHLYELKNEEYLPYLRNAHPSSDAPDETYRVQGFGCPDWYSVIPFVESMREGLISKRGRETAAFYQPVGWRCVAFVHHGSTAATEAVSEFANWRNMRPDTQNHFQCNEASWDSINLHSFDDNEILALTNSCDASLHVVQAAEIAHHAWFVARAWVGLLHARGEALKSIDASTAEMGELHEEVLQASRIRHLLAASLAEADLSTLMFKDTRRAQMVEHLTHCYCVSRVMGLAEQQLTALDRQTDALTLIIDRQEVERSMTHSLHLEYIFSAAVAAGVIGLAVSARQTEPQLQIDWVPTLAVATVFWVILVAAGEMLRRRLRKRPR